MKESLNHRQHGAALIVGLVLMMVLTILAISTMRTATLELAMAGNTQYQETAQQLAEAGLTHAVNLIDSDQYTPIAVNPGGWIPGVVGGELVAGSGDTYTVDIRYLNTGDPPASGSRGVEGLQANYFELRSTGRTAARNARSVLIRGFWKYADFRQTGVNE